MPYYPQLVTGAITQFPINRHNSLRTLVNALADGREIRVSDAGAATVRWELTHTSLTGSERDALQQLFDASFGRWQSFTFLDPTDNLLAWSEDLMQPLWKADPLVDLTAGVADPLGGNAAMHMTNGSQTVQQVGQKQAIPARFQYCLSAWLRSDQPLQLELFGSNGSTDSVSKFTSTSAWTRVFHSFQIGADGDGLTVGVRLPSGSTVSLFGLQLEAQVGPGGYKKTRDRSGVYPNCRFDEDALAWTAHGINQYACKLRIVSNVAG